MAKNGMPHQTLAMIGPHMRVSRDRTGCCSASCHEAEREQPVRQRADDGIEQPGPVQAGQEGRHRPGQEHQRLHHAAAAERLVEQQRQDQAEDELQQHRDDGPPHRVAQRVPEILVVGSASRKLVEPDKVAAEGIEELDVAEGIGDADDQRHQHDRRDAGSPRAAHRARARARAAGSGAARSGRVAIAVMVMPFAVTLH